MHSADTYAVARLGLYNALNNTKESESRNNTTYAVVSDGNFNIGSNSGKENIAQAVENAKRPEYQALEQIDHKQMLEDVKRDREVKQETLTNFAKETDKAYKNEFLLPHRLMTWKLNEKGEPIEDKERLQKEATAANMSYDDYVDMVKKNGGNIHVLREVSDDERERLEKAEYINPRTGKTENKTVLGLNGINNDMQPAAKYALKNYVAVIGEDGQLSGDTYKGVYFIHNPNSGTLTELFIAGYQKFLEGNLGFDLTNSTVQARDLMEQYGQDNLFIGAHSRGTLTAKNAMDALNTKENRNKKVLSGTTVKFVGAAANATRADKTLNQLQGYGNKRTAETADKSILIETQAGDLVSGFPVGLNPRTYPFSQIKYIPVLDDDGKPKKDENGQIVVARQRYLLELPLNTFAIGSEVSAHNCYGKGNADCVAAGYRQDKTMRPEMTIYERNHPELFNKGEKK